MLGGLLDVSGTFWSVMCVRLLKRLDTVSVFDLAWEVEVVDPVSGFDLAW